MDDVLLKGFLNSDWKFEECGYPQWGAFLFFLPFSCSLSLNIEFIRIGQKKLSNSFSGCGYYSYDRSVFGLPMLLGTRYLNIT